MAIFLVTGGCGFIGSHLCDAIVARGDRVRVIDDLSTGFVANLPPGAEFLRGDVCDTALVDAATDGVDGVFHLAAIASVERGLREWAHTNRVNLGGTIAVLDAVRKRQPRARVVYASSAAVYGECASLPIRESADTRPVSAYGADKLGSELHAHVATRVHGISTVGLRFFNVYGPRQNPASPYSGVISKWSDALRAGRPLRVFGDGRQTRDFIYVKDIARYNVLALQHDAGGVCNVGSGNSITLLELIDALEAAAGAQARRQFEPPAAGDIQASAMSPQRLNALFGAQTPTPLIEGLQALLLS